MISNVVRNINVKISAHVPQPENCTEYLDNLETLLSNSLHLANDVTKIRYVEKISFFHQDVWFLLGTFFANWLYQFYISGDFMNLKYQQLQDQLSSWSAPSHRMVLLSFSISFFLLIFSIKGKMNGCNCNQLGQLHRHRQSKIIWVAEKIYPSSKSLCYLWFPWWT